jgi:hypothetical protein
MISALPKVAQGRRYFGTKNLEFRDTNTCRNKLEMIKTVNPSREITKD